MSAAPEEYLEVVQTIEHIQDQLESLAVRGLRATDATQLAPIHVIRDEFARINAGYLAGRLSILTKHVVDDDRGSAVALLAADSAVRLFERRLTLDVAAAKLTAHQQVQRTREQGVDLDELDEEAAEAPATPATPAASNGKPGEAPPPLLIAPPDRAKLPALLKSLATGVEELLKSGLTSASEALRQTLDVAFREASRMKLLRLGSSLKIAIDELGRFTRGEPEFSKKRLLFFLSRSWILSGLLARALEANDEASASRLLQAAPNRPIDSLSLVTLGVVKRVARGSAAMFEFRLRTTQDAPGLPAGSNVVWSCVFPSPNGNVPPEAYLRLEQKQKFKPWELLEGREFHMRKAAFGVDAFGGRRLGLTDQTTIEFGDPVADWKRFYVWDANAALDKIRAHRPTPLDVPIELQTEAILHDWKLDAPRPQLREGRQVVPGSAAGLTFQADVSAGPDGDALRKALAEQAARDKRLPLFGVMHYEMGEAVLQPLSVLGDDGPIHLTISTEAVNMKELLKTIRF